MNKAHTAKLCVILIARNRKVAEAGLQFEFLAGGDLPSVALKIQTSVAERGCKITLTC